MGDSKSGVTKNVLIKMSVSELNEMYTPQEIRELFPVTVNCLTRFRERFPSCQVTYICEGGFEVTQDDD